MAQEQHTCVRCGRTRSEKYMRWDRLWASWRCSANGSCKNAKRQKK